jgi:hypothetical protein
MENDFHGAFEALKNHGIAVYVPKGVFWRRWQPKLRKLSQYFFLDLVREFSDKPRMIVHQPHTGAL